jgi:hypothetical protein
MPEEFRTFEGKNYMKLPGTYKHADALRVAEDERRKGHRARVYDRTNYSTVYVSNEEAYKGQVKKYGAEHLYPAARDPAKSEAKMMLLKNKVDILQERTGYGGENGDAYTIYDIKMTDGTDVQIHAVSRGDWEVIWDGAVDFNGTKEQLLKNYPEFRGYI